MSTIYPSKIFRIVLELGGFGNRGTSLTSLLSALGCELTELEQMLQYTPNVRRDGDMFYIN